MKRRAVLLLFTSLLLCLLSCADEVEPESITDALKISAWLLDENLEGTGYWAYSESHRIYPDGGYWVSNDSDEQIATSDVFKLERLELNHPRVMAPMGYNHMPNLNIYLDFEGLIKVETDIPDDETIRLAHSLSFPNEPGIGNWTIENSFSARAPFVLNVCPIGRFTNAQQLILNATLTEREYYINIYAYKEDGTLFVTAQLKLVVLKDEAYPYDKIESSGRIFSPNEERSRFLSIELVSYEYNDIYKFDETSK